MSFEKVDKNSHESVANKPNECFKCNFNKISKQMCWEKYILHLFWNFNAFFVCLIGKRKDDHAISLKKLWWNWTKNVPIGGYIYIYIYIY